MRASVRSAVLAVAALIAACTAKPSIAVSDLLSQGIESSAALLISDRLRSELFRTSEFTVLERGQMDEVLKEQGFQQSGCVSDACAVEVGQLLGVTHIVVGTVGKVGKTFTVNIRLLEVATGRIANTVSIDCKCEIDDVLSKSTRDAALQISKSLIETPASAPGEKQVSQTPPAVSDTTGALDRAASSAAPQGRTHNRRARVIVQISSGLVAVGGAAAAFLYNSKAQEQIDEAAAIKASTTSANYSVNAPAYASAYEDAQLSITLRNLGCVAAGIGAVGFGLSFLF